MTHNTFANDLRRTLYILEIAKVELEWLRKSSVCPSGLKQHCINSERSMTALRHSIILGVSAKNAEFIRTDLSKDQIHGIAEMLHLLADVQNVDDIVEAVRVVKNENVNQEV